MTWINPKTDWQAGDGIMAGDLNRIENNTEYLELSDIYRVFDLQGIANTASGTNYASIRQIIIPPNSKLVVTHAGYYALSTNSTPIQPYVRVFGGDYHYFTNSNEVWDINTAPVIYTNTTTTDTSVRVELSYGGFYGSGGSDLAMWARVVIRPI